MRLLHEKAFRYFEVSRRKLILFTSQFEQRQYRDKPPPAAEPPRLIKVEIRLPAVRPVSSWNNRSFFTKYLSARRDRRVDATSHWIMHMARNLLTRFKCFDGGAELGAAANADEK